MESEKFSINNQEMIERIELQDYENDEELSYEEKKEKYGKVYLMRNGLFELHYWPDGMPDEVYYNICGSSSYQPKDDNAYEISCEYWDKYHTAEMDFIKKVNNDCREVLLKQRRSPRVPRMYEENITFVTELRKLYYFSKNFVKGRIHAFNTSPRRRVYMKIIGFIALDFLLCGLPKIGDM